MGLKVPYELRISGNVPRLDLDDIRLIGKTIWFDKAAEIHLDSRAFQVYTQIEVHPAEKGTHFHSMSLSP